MKRFLIFLGLIFLNIGVYSSIPPRKPFVVLRINGKDYKQSEKIEVRPGERLELEAVLLGGRRDYCSNPQKYANVGRNTVIQSSGEDGMSFYIGNGSFRGTWSLVSERAIFSAGQGLRLVGTSGEGKKENKAEIEIPQSGYSQVYLKVKVNTKWHYVRHTPAGRREKDEEQKAEATFYFVIKSAEGVWYSSANLTAKGNENFSVRNDLNDIQSIYDQIYEKLLSKDFAGAKMYVSNLKSAINNLKATIDNEKQKNPDFKCEITFIGLPTSRTMTHLKAMETLSLKLRELYMISEENVSKINDLLLKTRTGLSANILKSVFKNYINWGTSIPTGYTDFLTLYDPSNTLSIVSMPSTFMGWWEDANKDASILKNQFMTIKKLSALQRFYMEQMNKSIEERKKIISLIKELSPVKEIDKDLRVYFSSLSWAKLKL
jgi:hypothetical protein